MVRHLTRCALLMVVALALASPPAQAANLATVTPVAATVTPAATPVPKAGTSRLKQRPTLGGGAHEKAETFEGGAQIGTEAAGASLVTFLKVGACTIDLPAIAAVATPVVGPPNTTKVWCTATGAAVGDTVLATLEGYDNGEYAGLRLHAASVTAANTLQLIFAQGSLAGLDPGPLTVRYVVFR